PDILPLKKKLDVIVVDHGYRSVTAIPYPLNVNTASRRLLLHVPYLSRSDIQKILLNRPVKSVELLEKILSNKKALNFLKI
ncbi:MAG: radical SAM protein, partial [Thermoprotei archaeon]